MKVFPLLLVFATAAAAQTNLSRFLEQGIVAAGATFKPVNQEDRRDLLTATAILLSKHVTFRPDGTASSFHWSGTTRRTTEWKRLVVTRITAQSVTEADRLNGITRRFLVGFGCDAHRTWNTKANRWGQWYNTGNPHFPSALAFEWKNNSWTASGAERLKSFSPGPGPSIADPRIQTGVNPAGKDTGLPPGMSRAGR